jgi:hypothetical protein
MGHLAGVVVGLMVSTVYPPVDCSIRINAVIALLRGDWQTSLTFHAFAIFFVIALALIALATVLPVSPRYKMIKLVENLEQRTGLTVILLMGVVIYWLGRLLILREAYINLIVG